MNEYVAAPRAVTGSPRLTRPDRDAGANRSSPAAASTESTIEETGIAIARETGRIAERRAAFRERWSQLLFYLLDSDSWRS